MISRSPSWTPVATSEGHYEKQSSEELSEGPYPRKVVLMLKFLSSTSMQALNLKLQEKKKADHLEGKYYVAQNSLVLDGKMNPYN